MTINTLPKLCLLASIAVSQVAAKPQVCNQQTSLTLLFQNNLNATDDANHGGAILLDSLSLSDAQKTCASLGESLISDAAVKKYSQDFSNLLSYLQYSTHRGQQYRTADGTISLGKGSSLQYASAKSGSQRLPALCTQSSRSNASTNTATTSAGQTTVESNDNSFTGYRNLKSFRFSGIPYADAPRRFTYSQLYSKTGQTIDATKVGADCAQAGDAGSSEDCLFLNIQTPYIPLKGSRASLRPVLFSIHGGGFTGGSGAPSSGQDGGNLASREDIVSVQINYRLSTLGFLAVPGTDIKGNYGIGDQVTALRWVQKNIAAFGGDPNKITIIGESAGAGSVRALLGSPPAIRESLFHGAVAQSNLGGGVTLGLNGNYGTTYSSYYTIDQSYAVAGQAIFQGVGCNSSSLAEQIACLKAAPASTIINLPTVARYVVQDGTFVKTEQLVVSTRNGSTAHVPTIFGTTANDGASIGSSYPKTAVTSEVDGISQSLSITTANAQSIIDSGLFPLYDTGNLTLDAFNVSQRVATDITVRCVDEATMFAGAVSKAFPSAFFYQMDRTYQGYDPNNLGLSGLSRGPVSAGYPNGNPEVPYFRLHGSDLGFTYGNQFPLRDAQDLQASQLISNYFAQFTRTGDSNVDQAYLQARGYDLALQSVKQSGPWLAVSSKTGPAKTLDAVSKTVQFPDLPQCAWLKYPIDYYLNGGR